MLILHINPTKTAVRLFAKIRQEAVIFLYLTYELFLTLYQNLRKRRFIVTAFPNVDTNVIPMSLTEDFAILQLFKTSLNFGTYGTVVFKHLRKQAFKRFLCFLL